jgi:hypothetical protein
VQHVVAVTARQCQQTPAERDIAQQLAYRETNRHVADERHRGRAEHAYAAQRGILADVIGQHVDLVAGRLEGLD